MRRLRQSLQPAALILGLCVLLVLAIGAHHSFGFCRGTCEAHTAAASTTSSCCHGESAPACCVSACGRDRAPRGDDDDGQTNGSACLDCCVLLCVEFETGPLPKATAFDTELQLAAALPLPPTATRQVEATAFALPCATGPPRPDPRHSLRSTIQLLL